MLKNKTAKLTNLLDIDNALQYLARKSPVYLERESRIVFEGQQESEGKCNNTQNGANLLGVVKSTTLLVAVANLIIHFV